MRMINKKACGSKSKLVTSCSLMAQLMVLSASAAIAAPTVASAQEAQTISVAPMPLADALAEIQRQSGVRIDYDPDAVAGLNSANIPAAVDGQSAVQQAIARTDLSLSVNDDGSIVVARDIVVTAQRDEAETSLFVRQNSSSNRNGTSLRDQPRNAEVISSKLIDEQQATSVRDALRYAGGVSGSTDSAQGQGTFYVRGFPVAPLSNGLAGPGTVGNLGGTGGSIDTVERIEVLKGPDALLSGTGNLGGVVNVVTKKPFADFFAEATSEVGLTFGDWRVTGDLNGALTRNKLLSARVIGTVKGGGRTYGGYDAGNGYTIAPSIRYKDAATDILLSGTRTDEFIPLSPYAVVPFGSVTPLPLPRNKPVLGRSQGLDLKTTQLLLDASHDLTQNLTGVVRYQHTYNRVAPKAYALFGADPTGTAFLSTDADRQFGPTDSFDGYLRARFRLGPIRNTLNAGFNYVTSTSTSQTAFGDLAVFNLLTDDVTALPARRDDFVTNTKTSFEQKGYYAQDLLEFGPVHVVAGIRRTDFKSVATFFAIPQFGIFEDFTTITTDGATPPSAGIVVDLAKNISVFANYLEGFVPTFATAFDGTRLPNVKSKNREGGVKVDLFDQHAVLNLSYFRNDQSNVLLPDPINGPTAQIAGPGRRAEGFDLNVAGQPFPGLSILASYTRTNYSNLSEAYADFLVVGQPKDTYSAYANYSFALTGEARAAIGAGITGRSSAQASVFGRLISPAANQVDINGAVVWRGFDVRLGVRNLFDRKNYGISFTETQLPIAEPRTVRLTVGYKF